VIHHAYPVCSHHDSSVVAKLVYKLAVFVCCGCAVQVEIKLCCLIGDTTARDLAAGLEHLEDELIIRIDVRIL
jgi:hypothetical protein